MLQQNRSNWKCLVGKNNNRGQDKDTHHNKRAFSSNVRTLRDIVIRFQLEPGRYLQKGVLKSPRKNQPMQFIARLSAAKAKIKRESLPGNVNASQCPPPTSSFRAGRGTLPPGKAAPATTTESPGANPCELEHSSASRASGTTRQGWK